MSIQSKTLTGALGSFSEKNQQTNKQKQNKTKKNRMVGQFIVTPKRNSDIDFTNNSILTNFNSYPITGENFVAIRQE